MGKVFTVEEIAGERYPEAGAHYAAGDYFLGALFNTYGPRYEGDFTVINPRYHSVSSAMVYGSTALGVATRRSDLDVLINFCESRFTDTRPVDKAFGIIHEVIQSTEQSFKVPVEPTILPHMALSNPLEHNVDPLFANHLFRVQDDPRWSHCFPVDGLIRSLVDHKPEPKQLRAFCIRYSSVKARQLASALSKGPEVNHQVLQRALELPPALGRKVVALARATQPELEGAFPEADDREGSFNNFVMASAGIQWPEFSHLTREMLELKSLDEEYSALLEATISGETNHSAYQTWLEHQYRPTLYLAYRIAHDWTQVLRDKFDVRDYEAEQIEYEQAMAAAESDWDAY